MAAPATPTREFITGLPKAELHVHLEGTLEPAMKLALAQRNGVDIGMSTVEEVEATYRYDDLTGFLGVYYSGMSVLQTEEDFFELGAAYLERAKADGVNRAEMFFDPQAHTSRGVPFADVVNGFYRACRQVGGHIGINTSLIMCFLRDMSAESAMEHLETSLAYRDKILGVGLDSDEKDNPPEKFGAVFARARELGYKITMHCDPDQVGSIDNIRTVVRDLKTDRIDHGSNVVEDPELVTEVRDLGLGLTCCPLSNEFIHHDLKAKELAELLRAGVKVTINSDDPAYFQGYVADNYVALAEAAGLTTDDVIQLARNSFDVAWTNDDTRAAYHAAIDDYVAGFESE